MQNLKSLFTVGGASLALIASLLTSGCASIVHGGARVITLNTSPAGATATISKLGSDEVVHRGVTPLTVSLEPKRGFFKGQSYNVRFNLAGYQTATLQLRSELSGWYFGNILFGGLIGMVIVDPATGSMWNIAPDKINHSLTPEQTTLIERGEGFVVALLDDVAAADRQSMVRLH